MAIRAVIDTNVLFEGFTRKGGASRVIIRAWEAGVFTPVCSDAVAYEYKDVLARKLSSAGWGIVQPALNILLENVEWTTIRYRWHPSSPDPRDEHLIDCAMSRNAILVTQNVKDFRMAERRFGLQVYRPVDFVTLLTRSRGY